VKKSVPQAKLLEQRPHYGRNRFTNAYIGWWRLRNKTDTHLGRGRTKRYGGRRSGRATAHDGNVEVRQNISPS